MLNLHSSSRMSRAVAISQATVLALVGILPLVISASASAAPGLEERELISSTAQISENTQLEWVFDTTSDVANIDQIIIDFCDSPLGTCTTVNTPTINTATPTATLTGFATGGNSTTRDDAAAGGTNNRIVVDKSTADAGANLDEASIELALTDVTNNASVNTTYYTRMVIYSDAGVTDVWEGVFAQSTSQTLTVSARVQERLDFCVGSTTVNDATTSATPANNQDCAEISGTEVELGVVEAGRVNVSPVTIGDANGNAENGIAMIRTNAFNGAVIDYKAIQETASGKLKVTGATCSGITFTDQCFNSQGATSSTINGVTEESFGFAVGSVNCGSVDAYTCDFSAGTYNLVRDEQFDGDAGVAAANYEVTESGVVTGTTASEYTWDDTGTSDRVASSATSAIKVIDDEALILKFAASPAVTTPTGLYSTQADFIATTTF